MSILNAFTRSYTIFLLISQCCSVMAISTSTETETSEAEIRACYYCKMFEIKQRAIIKFIDKTIKRRYKRDLSEDKLKDASTSSSIKSIRQFLQMVKNLFTTDPAGGNHPLSKQNPPVIVRLFKSTIYAYLFPEPGGKRPKSPDV